MLEEGPNDTAISYPEIHRSQPNIPRSQEQKLWDKSKFTKSGCYRWSKRLKKILGLPITQLILAPGQCWYSPAFIHRPRICVNHFGWKSVPKRQSGHQEKNNAGWWCLGKASQKLQAHSGPCWNSPGVLSPPKPDKNALQGNEEVHKTGWSLSTMGLPIVARMETIPFPMPMAVITNQWCYSFLLSPDRVSESFPTKHTWHMLLKDQHFPAGWSLVVISFHNIHLAVFQHF